MLSTAEVAQRLGVSTGHIWVILGRHPELAPRKIGRAWVWSASDVEAVDSYIKRNKEGETTEEK
jgi:predicted DNA-binding transcriptional regulator AlpA